MKKLKEAKETIQNANQQYKQLENRKQKLQADLEETEKNMDYLSAYIKGMKNIIIFFERNK